MEYSGLDYHTIADIIKNVDIVKLQSTLEGTSSNGKSEDTIKSSGIVPLNEVIKKILAPYSEKYFFEYALLPSTLDPDKEKLYSMSAIQDSENKSIFKKDIEDHVKNIIETLYEKHDDNFFHNPETFLAPTDINIIHSFSDTLDPMVATRNKQKLEEYEGVLQREKLEEFEDISRRGKSEGTEKAYFQGSEELFFSNMTYTRKFEDIITSAKKIFDKYKGNSEKLKIHYEKGAADLRYFYDIYIKSEAENACYITLPIISSSSEGFPQLYRQVFKNELDGKLQGIGVCFIYFILKDNSVLSSLKQQENIHALKDKLFVEVNNIVRIFTYNLVFNIGLRLFERAKENSIKSAIAAIMARNMSHNLGSHVITNAKYQIENLAKQQKDPLAKQLNGVTKLLQYLQERQDFIAVIANDERYAKGPMNFKNAVFDMIAMDGPAIRHRTIESDDSKKINNYILDNIVRSEGIYRKDSISTEGTIELEIQMVTKTASRTLVFKSFGENESESKEFNHFICAVPYGLNGRQAFLTIIENIIRNSAKHGKSKLQELHGEPLTFPIIINETAGNQFEVIISDNKRDFADVIRAFEENSIIDPETGHFAQLHILSETGHGIDKSNKGIKEILICLAWMKSKDGIIDYSQIQDHPELLAEIVGVDENYNYYDVKSSKLLGTTGHLSMGYKFCVEKHLLVYNITEDEFSANLKNNFTQLPAASIYLVPGQCIKDAKLHLPRVAVSDHRKSPEQILKDIIIENLYGKDKKFPILLVTENLPPAEPYKDFDSNLVKRQYKMADMAIDRPFVHFRNHYEAEKLAVAQTKEDLGVQEGSIFSEGISGGNYTHNLIRTDIEELTYLQIIEAALTKIAIVDERIFSKYGGITPGIAEQAASFQQQSRIDELIAKLLEEAKNESFPYTHDYLIALNKILEDFPGYKINDAFKSDFDMKFQNNSVELRKALYKHLTVNEIKVKDTQPNPVADYLENKNIFILNCDEEGRLYDLRGEYLNLTTDFRFDFVSLHLSLLEKILTNDNRDVNQKLKEIINSYHLTKSKTSLHSGRGGLNTVKNVTFIPLSGIDWALDNCKYVLTELFYGLKYHPL